MCVCVCVRGLAAGCDKGRAGVFWGTAGGQRSGADAVKLRRRASESDIGQMLTSRRILEAAKHTTVGEHSPMPQ